MKNHTVKTKRYGIIHCMAYCETCDKVWGDLDVDKSRRNARAHTLKTGHETGVETGTSTTYKRINKA